MLEHVNNLEGVKPGDKFIIYPYTLSGEALPEVVICTRVMTKQAEIGRVKYWIKNASPVGCYSDRWRSQPHLRKYDEEIINKANRQRVKNAMISKIQSSPLKSHSFEALEIAYNALFPIKGA
jgi:hypothetical protein